MDSQKQSGYFSSGMRVKIDKITQATNPETLNTFLFNCIYLSALEIYKNDFVWKIFCRLLRLLNPRVEDVIYH